MDPLEEASRKNLVLEVANPPSFVKIGERVSGTAAVINAGASLTRIFTATRVHVMVIKDGIRIAGPEPIRASALGFTLGPGERKNFPMYVISFGLAPGEYHYIAALDFNLGPGTSSAQLVAGPWPLHITARGHNKADNSK